MVSYWIRPSIIKTFQRTINLTTHYNTDNKVNKFVTVFALPLHLDKFLVALASGYAQLLATKLLHRDRFIAPKHIVPRHCSSARQQFCNR
jgi:hypothetical protein